MKNIKTIKRGEIYYVTHRREPIGSVQSGVRPGVIISNDVGNYYSTVVTVAYMTTATKTELPTHVKTAATGKSAIILCEQIETISKEQLCSKCMGAISPKEMQLLDKALACSVGLDGRMVTK